MNNFATTIPTDTIASMANLEIHVTSHDFHFSPIVSEEVRRITEIVIDLTASFILSLLGIFTNVVVIAVFAKQGFKDSVGITMTIIAFWDLIKCLGGAAQRMSGPVSLWAPAEAKSWSNMSVVVFNYLISFSSYVTSVLAAYVAVERCLCVSIPLYVKKLLTRKTSCAVCTIISVLVFGCFAVIYDIYDIVWEFDPEYNTTITKYRYNQFSTNNTHLFEYYNVSGIVWPMASLLVIISSTVIISYKLRQASLFRYRERGQVEGASANSSQPISKRDGKVVKMLLVVVAIYIVSLFPRVTVYIVKYFVYEFYFLRKYHNVFMTCAYIVYFFDLLNGAVNLFIFLRMSSVFRATCKEMFTCSRLDWRKVTCVKKVMRKM